MVKENDISDGLNRKILNIRKEVISGDMTLLELELVPIFMDLKDSISIHNINSYSKTFKQACDLLEQKFQELRNLLQSIGNDEIFLDYLKSNPSEAEISHLFHGCWRKPFYLDSLSLTFLETSNARLSTGRTRLSSVEHLERMDINEEFLLEISREKFTVKMMKFFDEIKNKIPCSFDEIFEDELNQVKIYEYFVYLLHLLQIGKLKYQKETNFLYL